MAAVLSAVVVISALTGLWVAFTRSLIPHSVSGQVEEVGWVDGAAGRLQTVEVSGRELVVDTRVAGRIEVGDHVEKDVWSRSLLVNEETVRLPVPGEVWRLAVVAAIVLGGISWVLHPLVAVSAHPADAEAVEGGGDGAGSGPRWMARTTGVGD